MRFKGGGPSEENKSEEDLVLVKTEDPRTPTPKKAQYGLSKFFGTPEQKASAQPVLAEQVVPYQRKSKSRAQLEAEAAREQYLDLVAAEEAEQGDELHALEVAKRRKLSSGTTFLGLRTSVRRKLSGPKLELTANKKVSIIKMLEESMSEFADLGSYWKAMCQRTGLSKRQLRHMQGSADKYKLLAEQPLKKQNSKNKRRKRQSGAGRKIPFPKEVAQLQQWLEVERACGHTVTKAELLREFCSLLRHSAEQLRREAQSSSSHLSPLQKAEKVLQAQAREERAQKVSNKRNYAKSFIQKLLKWTGAKFLTAEVVANISELEAEVRCKLTWQEFDCCLWLSTLSTEKELTEAAVVADPAEFVAQRKHLVIGFSDQVPLWAKAPGRKAIFAETEMHPSAAKKDFSEVRQAIHEAMHLEGDAEMLVEPLPSPGFQTPRKTQSTDSLGGDSVKRALSFGSTPEKQPALEDAKPEMESATPDKPLLEAATSENPPAEAIAEKPAVEDESPEKAKPEEHPQRRVTGKQKPASEPQPQQSLPKRGSLTIQGHSGEERFRITYEARQLLRNIFASPEEPVTGSVGKGLLVVPGQWARLSNISADGKWLNTERFKIGAKEFVHSQGASVGRILEAYRKVRASHPELVAQLDIMSQPAANVDSVILSWCIEKQATEHSCSLWQRDCFSSVFSQSATKAMALAQQISCLVAAKCTSKLQITDSDFAKQFKSLVRKKLIELRHDFQHQPQPHGKDPVFRVGALEIVKAVVSAQQAMSEKNDEDQWVLRAAVRNGILAWRPNPDKGCLEEVTTQPWCAEMDLSMGSKRIPAEWLRDRLRWLTENKVPRKPDWSLSDSAKNISDLLRWDYYNPLEDSQNDNPEGLDLEGDLAEELALEADNSLALRLHPSLRRQAMRRAAEEGFQEERFKLKVRSKERLKRQKLRTQLRQGFVKAVKERLSNTSRQDVLSGLVPQTAGKPGAKAQPKAEPGKPSLKLKPSLKKKKSLKEKPSAKKKKADKKAQKALADKELSKHKKAAKKSAAAKKKAKPEAPPPLPPPAEKPEEAEFLNQQVVVSSEAAGALSFGRQGLATAFSKGKYHVATGNGSFSVSQEFLSLMSSKPKTAIYAWPKWNQLSKADTQSFLKNLFVWPEPRMLDWTNSHEFVPVTEETMLLEDQQLWLGWQLLRWSLSKMGHGVPEDSLSLNLVDPALGYCLRKFPEDPLRQAREQALRDSTKAFRKILLPIGASDHWVLLVAEKETAEQEKGFRWRLYDSLESLSEGMTLAITLLGTLMDSEFKLPEKRCNSVVQAFGLNECGFYTLSFIEQEVRLARGEWLSHHSSELQKLWKQRLTKASQHMSKELSLKQKANEDLEKKAEAMLAEANKRKEAAEKALAKMKNLETAAAKAAQESIKKNSIRFTWEDLSPEAESKILALEHARGICARCRWQSGCLSCDAVKALRYWVCSEARSKRKIPFLSAGHLSFGMSNHM